MTSGQEFRPDPNVVARLMDGALPAHERAEVLARLARDPEAVARLADAAAAVTETGEPSGVALGTAWHAFRQRPWFGLAAAAAIAVVALGVLRFAVPTEDTFLIDPGARYDAAWPIPSLAVSRGERDTGDADFLLGVHALRWSIAVSAGAAAAARDELTPLLKHLENVPAAAPLAVLARRSTEAVESGSAPDPQAVPLLRDLAAADPSRAAGWIVEQIRLGNWPDSARFDIRSARTRLRTLIADPATPATLTEALTAVEQALEDRAALRVALESLYDAFAR